MTSRFRPRRSALFMPGDNARAHAKARTLPADCILLDLEDAVGPSAKDVARQTTVATVRQGGFRPRELVVRVNGLDTPWGAADVESLAHLPLDALLLPKVESAEQVGALDQRLSGLGASPDLRIWCMIETPRGVLEVPSIASAGGRLEVLVVGTSDLTKELRARHTPDRAPVLTALSMTILAARANALGVLDGVYLTLDDDQGFARACIQGRDLGFDGKTLIHPRQVDAANATFGPTDDERATAREIVAAWDAAQSAGRGLVTVRGRLVENLHYEEARRTLQLDDAIRQLSAATTPSVSA